MARSETVVIRERLQEAYETIRERVAGLTDDEFFWEPVPGCWTVRLRDDGRWAVDFGGGIVTAPDNPVAVCAMLVGGGHRRANRLSTATQLVRRT